MPQPQSQAIVIPGQYLADLLAQPEALRAVSRSLQQPGILAPMLAKLESGTFRRVILTGMGTSWHALYPLHRRLVAAGWWSAWIETAELLAGQEALLQQDTLLIAVSQSGESAEIVRLLQHAPKLGHIIGVTNSPESTLGRSCHTPLFLHAGNEGSVACKTCLNSMALLHGLAAAITGDRLETALQELETATAAAADYLARWRDHVDALLPLVNGVRCVFVTGRSASLAAALAGGLILKESTHQPAEGLSGAAFRHGPLEMVGPDVLVLVLAGDEPSASLNRRLASDIARSGGRVEVVAASGTTNPACRIPCVPAAVLPIVEMLPVQMLSLALAARDGREAGRFEKATKVTTID